MIIEVFARRLHHAIAGAFVEQLRAEGQHARLQDPRHFHERDIDKGTVLVYHDGTDPLVPWAYAKRGITCELIPGIKRETTHDPVPDDHRLVRTEGGFALEDGAGQQIGDVQPNEADAWAQRELAPGIAFDAAQIAGPLVDPVELVGRTAVITELTGDGSGEQLPDIDPGLDDADQTPEDEELAQLQREIDALEAAEQSPAAGATE